MHIFRQLPFTLLFISIFFVSSVFFSVTYNYAYAIPDDGNRAQPSESVQNTTNSVQKEKYERNDPGSPTNEKVDSPTGSEGRVTEDRTSRSSTVRGGRSHNGSEINVTESRTSSRQDTPSTQDQPPKKRTGFFAKIFGDISDFFSNVFSRKNRGDNQSQPVREFPVVDRNRGNSTKTNNISGVTAQATAVNAGQVDTTYIGQIMYTGDGFGEYTKSKAIQNKLLIDYGCDATIDVQKDFLTTNTSIRSGDSRSVPLSVRNENGPEGNHCFAFEVDTTNVLPRKNKDTLKTSWYNFTVSSNEIPQILPIPQIPTERTNPTRKCPSIERPTCNSGQQIINGRVGSDGCSLPSRCVSVGSTGPDDILFEVKSYTTSSQAQGGVNARIIMKDWSSDNITLQTDEKLAFRWEAQKYTSCLASIHPEKYDFNRDITFIKGNTEDTGTVLKSLNTVYSIECTKGNGTTYKKEISVQVL